MERVELTKAWLSFIASLAWPTVALGLVLTFRGQLRQLIGRLRSGEVAGAKFAFAEAAAGLISAKVDALAQQPDSTERQRLAGEIKDVAAAIGGLHPRALGILITAIGGMVWKGSVGDTLQPHFAQLERMGYAKVIRKPRDHDGLDSTQIRYTEKSLDLMRSIGFSDDDLQHARRYLASKAPALQHS